LHIKVALSHTKVILLHNKIALSRIKVACLKNLAKHVKMWSSFEALVVGIVEVKTDCNSAARFKSYIFSENGT
jgi:hypothetical protein